MNIQPDFLVPHGRERVLSHIRVVGFFVVLEPGQSVARPKRVHPRQMQRLLNHDVNEAFGRAEGLHRRTSFPLKFLHVWSVRVGGLFGADTL